MKCPFCQQYSMTYNWRSMQYVCHQYNAVMNEETMPEPHNNGWHPLGYVDA